MKRSIILATALFSLQGLAQNDFANVVIEPIHLADSVHMLKGAGGNIGVSAGSDGILIIDDQYEPLAERIAKALEGINKSKLSYIVNTHYHGDHTGSNAWFKEHHHATVFAHENVRVRLAGKEDVQANTLPVVTYEQGVKFHFNGETINVMHLPKGHTDGDSVVLFENANVLHTGDLFFEGRFPYIDLNGGGTVAGYIANVESLISKIGDDTKLIPGHGKLANKADYQRFLAMMKETAADVLARKNAGQSLEKITKDGLDAKWKDWGWEFISEEKWIATLYNGQ
ncbi:MBL fold metallo-hydrolase [Aliiglaciecola sp. CAU 1673]|uniref:MBL fold metallo-hydrolase n=1 Tax=Aliiglaciecola sp. CAU 1673 TaxID=3032595 RepID=UPI0023DA80EF|nr:MBL fold metallo-hydrolase [Aliiglaciecola sp. CAU 1673]MDF2176809.1 MBL fold metallo-hydrolase [Aliiglaciecola sp. CAU 1673]